MALAYALSFKTTQKVQKHILKAIIKFVHLTEAPPHMYLQRMNLVDAEAAAAEQLGAQYLSPSLAETKVLIQKKYEKGCKPAKCLKPFQLESRYRSSMRSWDLTTKERDSCRLLRFFRWLYRLSIMSTPRCEADIAVLSEHCNINLFISLTEGDTTFCSPATSRQHQNPHKHHDKN